MTTHRRRLLATAAGVLLLSGPLASCGFNYATDRVNTITEGTNDRSGEVDVLGAVVVSGQANTGVFAATLVNNSADAADSLVGLTGGDAGQVSAKTVTPIAVKPRSRANLFQTGGIPVNGDFGIGDFVTVTLTFKSGQTTTIDVNVVRPCDEFADVLPQGSDSSEPASPDAGGVSEQESDPYGCGHIESTVAPDGKAPEEQAPPDVGNGPDTNP